jgi:hypothetical protein
MTLPSPTRTGKGEELKGRTGIPSSAREPKGETRIADPAAESSRKGTTVAGERKVLPGIRLLAAVHAGVLPSDEVWLPKSSYAERGGKRPEVPHATLRPSMPAGEQAVKWVTWNHFLSLESFPACLF